MTCGSTWPATCRVLADPLLVEQAVAQLLENAAKYSSTGSVISVTARLEHQNVVIAVTDEGCGLTTTEKSLVGRRGFRGEQHRKFVPGSGLGLWMAHCLVAANGGLLEAQAREAGAVPRFPSVCEPSARTAYRQ